MSDKGDPADSFSQPQGLPLINTQASMLIDEEPSKKRPAIDLLLDQDRKYALHR